MVNLKSLKLIALMWIIWKLGQILKKLLKNLKQKTTIQVVSLEIAYHKEDELKKKDKIQDKQSS